ncbi:autotransporter outer membrane beta-barrel domain-containing protein [Deefgea sp. CFH1-16]|nr:autotransporter outer membrane beta-barrel domain-containing protein [Deefgea sp. CFH1-16]
MVRLFLSQRQPMVVRDRMYLIYKIGGQLTFIHRGATLAMAGNLALASNATLTNSGTLNVPVNAKLTAGLNNAGTISLGGGGQFSTLNVLGPFQSTNGLLIDHVSANLEKSSMLQIDGNLSGTTRVQFNNDGSSGRLGEQIRFAQSSLNTVTRGDTFIAANPVGARNIYDVRLKGSPYVWEIVQKNENGQTNWFLQTPFAPPVVPDANAGKPSQPVQPPLTPPVPIIVPVSPEVSPTLKPVRLLPEIPVYGILPAVSEIILRSNLSTLEQRLDAVPNVANDLWIKIDATHLKQSEDYGFSFDGWGSSVTIGIDRDGQLDDSKSWRGGAFLAWSHNQLNTSGEGALIQSRASADLDVNSFQTGLYGQLEKDGWYGRAIALLGYERAKVKTEDAYSNTLTAPIWAMSLGVGKVFEVFDNWTLAPQLNIGYANFNWDLQDESIKGRFEQTSHWYGGASIRVERRINTEENIWLRSGVTHQFGRDSALNLTAPNLYLPAAGPSTTWQMQLGYSKQTNWGSYYGLLGGSWARGQQLGKAELGLQWKW